MSILDPARSGTDGVDEHGGGAAELSDGLSGGTAAAVTSLAEVSGGRVASVLSVTEPKQSISPVADGYCVGDGATDDTAGMNAAFAAAAASGRYVALGPHTYKGAFVPVSGLDLRGAGGNVRHGLGSVLIARGTEPALTFSVNASNVFVRNVQIVGTGGHGVAKLGPGQPGHYTFEECILSSRRSVVDSAGLFCYGPLSEVWIRDCLLDGYRGLDVTLIAALTPGAISGWEIADSRIGGVKTNMRVRSTGDANGWVIRKLAMASQQQHAVELGGSLARWRWYDCYCEEDQASDGNGGRFLTAGSIAAGSNQLSVGALSGGSGTPITVGQQVTIEGAGPTGFDLTTTVDSIAGLVCTLAVQASTTVSGVEVTTAMYDTIHALTASEWPEGVGYGGGHLYDSCFFGAGSGSNIRYSHSSGGGGIFRNYTSNGSPIYDPYGDAVVIGSSQARVRTSRVLKGSGRGTVLAGHSLSRISLNRGQDLDLVFLGDGPNENSGNYGLLNVYPRSSSIAKTLSINPATGDVAGGRFVPLGGVRTLAMNSATPSVAAADVWRTANTAATSVTDFTGGASGQVVRVRCGDSNTTVVHGATINTNTGASKALAPGRVYTFVLDGTIWYEA